MNSTQDPVIRVILRFGQSYALNCSMAVEFNRRFGRIAAEVPIKFQSDTMIWTTN